MAKRTPVLDARTVVRRLANQQMLGHGDWQVTLAAVEDDAPSVRFDDDDGDLLFAGISDELRAGRLALLLLDYLQLDEDPDDKAWVRLRAMADGWLCEWVVAMGYGDASQAPFDPEGLADAFVLRRLT